MSTGKCYVYVHKNPKSGEIFYVGKGSGNRWKSRKGRNIYWRRYVDKYGFTPEIVIQGIKETCALSIEKAFIRMMLDSGKRIVNLVVEPTGMIGEDINIKYRKRLSMAHGKDGIYCSNGMKFDTLTHACEYLKDNGWPDASPQNISSAAIGKRGSAYDLGWSYEDFPSDPLFTGSKRDGRLLYKAVVRSDGVSFVSCTAASLDAKLRGYKSATGSAIGQSIRRGGKMYGYFWSFKND